MHGAGAGGSGRGARARAERPVRHARRAAPAERALLLESGTGPRRRIPSERVHPRAVRGAGARARPTRSRWSTRMRALTYGELNARANRLAHRLIALGVGARRPRGDCAGAQPRMVVGAARHPQGRRRLRAARSELSGRPAARSCSTTAQPRAAADAMPPRRAAWAGRRLARVIALDVDAPRWARRSPPRTIRRASACAAAISPTSSTPPAPPAAQRRDGRASRRLNCLLVVQQGAMPADGARIACLQQTPFSFDVSRVGALRAAAQRRRTRDPGRPTHSGSSDCSR